MNYSKMPSSDTSELQDVACFSCRGTQFESYLKSGYFKRFLDFELNKIIIPNVQFFGKIFSANSCMWTNMEELFMEIKRNFFIVKGIVLDNISSLRNDSHFVSIENLRMNILNVLQFFLANLQELSLRCSSSALITHCATVENNHLKKMLIQLVREIKKLLLFVGRISNIPGVVNIRDFSNDTSKSAASFYHYYHLCLDIWYSCFALVYNICFLIPINFDINDVFCDNFIDQPSPFLQLASLIMYEFISLAINRYRHANMYSNSPFLCPCIINFWVMLIHLIEKSDSFIEGVSFWGIYQSILQMIVKNASSVSLNEEVSIDTFLVSDILLHKQSPIEACLWITSHIAPLCKYNTSGDLCTYIKPKSGYISGKYLVHNLLSSPSETAEKSLRNALSYCLELVKLWEPSGEMLLPLTDFFIKKIEETFSIQGNEIAGLSYLFKDSSSWFAYINSLSNFNSVGRDSSFDRFLRILNLQLERDASSSLWRSLKGRIYSKFIPRKVKEISEIGLQNSFSLFLTIAASGQFEITGKICEVVSVIETAAYPRKQIISWKALFVLLALCQEKKQDMEKIVTLISKLFNSACSDYAKISKDSMHKANIMNLLLIYVDNMNEIFKRNNCLGMSECQLITSGFSTLFTACSITEVNYILGIFHTILQRIHKTIKSHHMEFNTNEAHSLRLVESIFSNIYPFVESIATTDTSPLVASDIAVAFTKISYDISSGLNCLPYDFQNIFISFGCKENVNCTISCRYLSNILDCPNIINELKLKVADLDTMLMQSWLKCTIYIHTKCDYMQELTQKVLKSEMVKIIPDFSTLDSDVDDHVKTSIRFYCLVGDAFNKSTSQQKTQMALKVQQIFKNYTSFVLNKIRKGKDGPSLNHVYKLISYLVEYCSIVLHLHVTSDHVLLQLLDKTIYPHILFSGDKALQSLVSCSVREYLPNILRGLFKLEYRRDKSVEREIRDITIYYSGIFPPSNNPIIKLVIDSVTRKPEGLTLDAYEFMLEVLKSSLLSSNVEKPTCILEFYQEVFRLTPPACKKEISNVLLTCSMEMFMKQNDSLSEYLRVLVKKTLVYFKEKMPLSHTKIILIPIIEWFIQEKLQWSVVRGFSVLDIFLEYLPQVMTNIVPFLTRSVETLEKNRGLGEDMLLRSGLRNVVRKLQQKLNQT